VEAYDIAIVGAGPAGSSAAIFLARRGYSVVLIDKKQFPREKLCGDFVNPANWPILQELGVEREILSRSHAKVTQFRMTLFSGEEAEVPFLTRHGETVFGLGLRRCDLDQVLLEKAKGQGVTIRDGFRITELAREPEGWRLEIDNSEFVETFRARLLIGADGRNSWVAHRLGMAARAAMQGQSIGFQLRLKCTGAANGRVEIHLFPGGYAGVIALGDGMFTLGFAVEKDQFHRQESLERLLDSCLTLNPHLKEIFRRSEVVGELHSTYPLYFPPRRSYGERVLLVGDAARVNEPVTGEGIYFALKSGELAAKALDRAFKSSNFSAARLRSYERDCQSEFWVRRGINALLRWSIYRPALISSIIRLSYKRTRLLDRLVQTICAPEAKASLMRSV
jgi:geranylgeranyl reductase family protein